MTDFIIVVPSLMGQRDTMDAVPRDGRLSPRSSFSSIGGSLSARFRAPVAVAAAGIDREPARGHMRNTLPPFDLARAGAAQGGLNCLRRWSILP
jgi:hypothetical protein